jgi:hypothetical protein
VKPAASTITEIGTLGLGAQVMGIDPKGMQTVLKILSNMYSDPELAVVREYAANAIDSHVMAGNDGPILVTPPSYLSPNLIIQDFGTGLSRDEVLNVFARYGASTKRETDTQIGSFGIGAKSAFAVGTQFIVTAVKDGMQTVALFKLDKDGAPTVSILSHTGTMELNGVTVNIGVRNVEGVKNAIDKLFPTWERGTVLVDGIEPASVWDDLSKLSDHSYIGFQTDRYDRSEAWKIVMGGVPYKIPDAVLTSLSNRDRQIIYNVKQSMVKMLSVVPIGAVDITPSREDLMVTTKTSEAVTELAEDFQRNVGTWISRQIEGATSVGAALMQFHTISKKMGSIASSTLAHVTWHGSPLPRDTVDLTVPYFNLHTRGYYGNASAKRENRLTFVPPISMYMDKYIFITNVPERRVRSVQLAAKPYLKSQERDGIKYVVALVGSPSDHRQNWFDPADPAYETATFDDFMKWKPKSTPAQRGEVRYEVHEEADPVSPADLNTMGKVFYLTYGERNMRLRNNELLDLTVNGQPIVMLTATQKPEVFLRRVPLAVPLHREMVSKAQDILDHLLPGDLDALFCKTILVAVGASLIGWLNKHRNKITNKVILAAVDLYQDASESQIRNQDRMDLLRQAAQYAHRPMPVAPEQTETLEILRKVATGLPLLYAYINSNRYEQNTPLGETHVIDYINSINL